MLFACPIVGVFHCSTKSAGKFRVLVTAFCLFGGVFDWELQGASRVAGQPDTLSLRAQGQVQMQDRESAGSKPSSADSQSKSGEAREAPFLKHALLFDPDSAELSAARTNALKRAGAWLHEHRETRILIVGFCDSSGSETCTPALAERRGTVARQYLIRFGAAPDQIAGVKGWENLNGTCRAGVTECQRQNRSARLFMAEPTESLK